jgi:hypothetical protein
MYVCTYICTHGTVHTSLQMEMNGGETRQNIAFTVYVEGCTDSGPPFRKWIL